MNKVVCIAIILLLGFFIYSHSAEILGVDDSYSYVNDSGNYDNISDYYPDVNESSAIDRIPVENGSTQDLQANYSDDDALNT